MSAVFPSKSISTVEPFAPCVAANATSVLAGRLHRLLDPLVVVPPRLQRDAGGAATAVAAASGDAYAGHAFVASSRAFSPGSSPVQEIATAARG